MLVSSCKVSSALKAFGSLSKWRLQFRVHPSRATVRTLTTVAVSDSWDVESFREQSYAPSTPTILPRDNTASPLAINKWFIHYPESDPCEPGGATQISELNESFWSQYSSLIVPLELTSSKVDDEDVVDFDRLQGPLAILLADLKTKGTHPKGPSIYLAQHDLRDLPAELQADLPTPDLISRAGNGDLYGSSLWLGRPPTYTPLHKDPNPNILMQLAGVKIVRLFCPDIGRAIFDHAQSLVNRQQAAIHPSSHLSMSSASYRGDEMMKGAERTILHDLVWAGSSGHAASDVVLTHAHDAVLHVGQALFIPKGWWHSVKGIGTGVTASANWWFR